MATTRRVLVVLCLTLTAIGAWTADAVTGTLHVGLSSAIRQSKDGQWKSLGLDLECRNGVWERDVYGSAPTYNRSEPLGQLLAVRRNGERTTFELRVEIGGDPWVKGGTLLTTVEVTIVDGTATGAHAGVWERVDSAPERAAGAVEGSVGPLLQPYPGFIPPKPGEHPRLLIRKADIPALQAKMRTPLGQELFARVTAAKTDMVAMGLAYALTGDRQYADAAKALILKAFPDKSGGPWSLARAHAFRMADVAMAADLIYESLDDPFRSRVAGYLAKYSTHYGLRPNSYTQKVNWDPGSNYMAHFANGPYTAQLFTWDAPGIFPPAPVAPVMTTVAPLVDVDVRVLAPCAPGAMPMRWLVAGPVFIDRLTESHLLPARHSATPRAGEFYRDFGHDLLADKITVGRTLTWQGHRADFVDLPQAAVVQHEGAPAIDVWAALRQTPCAIGYFHTVVKTTDAGWHTVQITPPNPRAAQANVHLAQEFPADFPNFITYREDATLYVNGQAVHDGDSVYLQAGSYALTLRATTRQFQALVQPRFIPTTEDAARDNLAALTARYAAEDAKWERYFDAYMRQPALRIFQRRAYRYAQFAFGDGGMGNESHGYPWDGLVMALPVSNVYRNATGVTLPHIGMNNVLQIATGARIHPESAATGFAIVPDAYKPAVLWAWNRAGGPKASPPVYAFLNYPLDMAEKHPHDVLPRPYTDKQMGLYVFRNRWQDGDDIQVWHYMKSFMPTGWFEPNAGTVQVKGFGKEWIRQGIGPKGGDRFLQENVVHFPADPFDVNGSGFVQSFAGKPDGSGVVCGNYDTMGWQGLWRDDRGVWQRDNAKDLGIRWTRWLGVDYSGTSGAPALIALVDRTQGGKQNYWSLNLTAEPKIDGQTFTVTQGNATLVGHVIAPAPVTLRYTTVNTVRQGDRYTVTMGGGGNPQLLIEGAEDYCVVMTPQRGPAPAVTTEGVWPNVTARVGTQVVRFDGTNLAVGE